MPLPKIQRHAKGSGLPFRQIFNLYKQYIFRTLNKMLIFRNSKKIKQCKDTKQYGTSAL